MRRLGWATCAAALLSLVVSCTSIPLLVPDLAAPSGGSHAVQLRGARGPLSSAQSKAVLERLRGGASNDILSRHLAIEEALVGTPLVTGNQVSLLQDGPATYRAMFAAIGAARDHINMETYILEDDEVGRQFADALIAKARAGVQVNLIRDSVGTLSTPSEFFQRLRDAGIQTLEFNPVNPLVARKGWDINQRDHRKLLIVDGDVAFLGGINISSVYSGGSYSQRKPDKEDAAHSAPWRDTDLQVRGPVVAEFQKLFMQTWSSQKGPAIKPRNYFPPGRVVGDQVVRAIGSSPDEPYSFIYATLLSAINNAENSIELTNAYFAPDPQLLSALQAATARGVKVRLILPSQTDSWLVFQAGRSYYEQLLKSGIEIYERRGVILHSKTALIDGVWSTVGSTNLDWRSFLHNQEVNAVILGASFGRQIAAMFERDLANSQRITLDQWNHRPWDLRLKESFARAWAYWL